MNQNTPKVIYLIVTGAISAPFALDLIRELTKFKLPIYTFMSDGAHRLISSWRLVELPGHRLVESYYDPVLANGRQPGVTLVVPATFNTVNRISHGLADSLALSLVAEAIGGGWPIFVAPSVNAELANHPRFKQSLDTLRQWQVTILEPSQEDEVNQLVSIETIIAHIETILEGKSGE